MNEYMQLYKLSRSVKIVLDDDNRMLTAYSNNGAKQAVTLPDAIYASVKIWALDSGHLRSVEALERRAE